jgi:hypothetical protein
LCSASISACGENIFRARAIIHPPHKGSATWHFEVRGRAIAKLIPAFPTKSTTIMAGTREHRYTATVTWTGNLGDGTSAYKAYSRNHEITAASKTAILGSSDPHFRGDAARWNPEELLVASLSACHKLWFLHLVAE